MSLISRFVSVFRAGHLSQEIQEEQEFHIASRTEEFIDAGMEPGGGSQTSEAGVRQPISNSGGKPRCKAARMAGIDGSRYSLRYPYPAEIAIICGAWRSSSSHSESERTLRRFRS